MAIGILASLVRGEKKEGEIEFVKTGEIFEKIDNPVQYPAYFYRADEASTSFHLFTVSL